MGKTLSENQVAEALAKKNKITKAEAKRTIENLDSILSTGVKSGHRVKTPWGIFGKIHRKAREGRNPATGEKIHIAAKTVVKIRPTKKYKQL